MTVDEFVALVGPQLVHVTADTNLPSIRERGLMRPDALAQLAGIDPRGLVLRDEAMTLSLPSGTATLNHQKPLRAGRDADFLDGCSLAGWSAQLDERLFFWPGFASNAFAGSVAARGATAILRLDSRASYQAFAPFIDLAPMNTGSATRRPALRGTWIYTPATQPVAAFQDARRMRGLVARRDRVVEVSVRCDIPPEFIASAAVVTRAGLNFARIGA